MFSISFLQLQWLFPVVVTLHNFEEAIWLPKWSKKAGKWHPQVGKREFRFAAVVIAILAYGLTYLSWSTGSQSIWTYLNCGFMLAMLINVFLPHLLGTMVLRQYVPGVVTGVLFNLPVSSLLLYLAFQEKWVMNGKFLLLAPITVVALLLSLPILFFLGRKMFGTE